MEPQLRKGNAREAQNGNCIQALEGNVLLGTGRNFYQLEFWPNERLHY